MLLVIGLAVILVALVAVVVDASRLFLYRRALATAADGAATSAVQAVDEAAVYRDPEALGRGLLPLDPSTARRAVEQYVQDAELAARFDAFAIDAVSVTDSAGVVTVTVSARVHLPFTSLMPLHSVSGSRIAVTAAARAPIR
jgi:Flp pilus assembly protein TadG